MKQLGIRKEYFLRRTNTETWWNSWIDLMDILEKDVQSLIWINRNQMNQIKWTSSNGMKHQDTRYHLEYGFSV